MNELFHSMNAIAVEQMDEFQRANAKKKKHTRMCGSYILSLVSMEIRIPYGQYLEYTHLKRVYD